MKDLPLNPLLSDRSRLLIMATLAASDKPIDFNTLVETLELSKGNLSTHIRKLEVAGFVQVYKEFVERKPLTTYRCTASGRKEVKLYLSSVEAMLRKI